MQTIRSSCMKYATTAAADAGVSPHPHTPSLTPSPSIHPPIHSHPRKTRHRCAHAPSPAGICRPIRRGAAATAPSPGPTHSRRGAGKSWETSCATSATRRHAWRRRCSCRGWGEMREALVATSACACITRARGVIGAWSIWGMRKREKIPIGIGLTRVRCVDLHGPCSV